MCYRGSHGHVSLVPWLIARFDAGRRSVFFLLQMSFKFFFADVIFVVMLSSQSQTDRQIS